MHIAADHMLSQVAQLVDVPDAVRARVRRALGQEEILDFLPWGALDQDGNIASPRVAILTESRLLHVMWRYDDVPTPDEAAIAELEAMLNEDAGPGLARQVLEIQVNTIPIAYVSNAEVSARYDADSGDLTAVTGAVHLATLGGLAIAQNQCKPSECTGEHRAITGLDAYQDMLVFSTAYEYHHAFAPMAVVRFFEALSEALWQVSRGI